MFHLAAFTAALGVNAADTDVTALSDQAITISNNHFVFTIPVEVWLAYYFAANATRARLATPKLRTISRPWIRPVERAANPGAKPYLTEYFRMPLRLNPIDETQLLGSNNLGAATEQSYGLLWVGDGNRNIPQGDPFTVRFTSTLSTVANTWTSGAIVLDEILPAGRYSVIGMDYFAATGVAARLIFPLQIWRPGVIAMTAVGNQNYQGFRWGFLGEYGQFESIAQPLLEVINTVGAVVVHEGYLDLIKVR